MKSHLMDLLGLFFPDQCRVCGEILTRGEKILCTHCLFHLPRTHYHRDSDNPVAALFWGRVPLVAATAFFYFEKGSKYQELLHKMKYRKQKEIGQEMGRLLGLELKNAEGFSSADMVVPVPLHPRKERQRGFNQSEWIARGVAEGMNKPLVLKQLVRKKYSSSQTRKSRIARWENVEKIFALKKAGLFAGKHVLLVDDVVTTGATLEACAIEILQAAGSRLSIATLAVA